MVPHPLDFHKAPPSTPPAPSPDPTAHDIPIFDSSQAPPPHTAAVRRPPSSPGPGQASGLRLRAPPTPAEGLLAAPTAPLTSTPPPHPTPRGSGPSPTTEATPARHPRSFIVDSKLPKWRRLLPPRKPPPAPTRPLAAASSSRPRPRPRPAPGAAPQGRPRPPALRPPSPTSAAARSHGAARVAARAELTRLLCPSPACPPPPPPRLPLPLPVRMAAAAAAPPTDKMARAPPPPRQPRSHGLPASRPEERGPGNLPEEKMDGRALTQMGAPRTETRGGNTGSFLSGKRGWLFPQLRRNEGDTVAGKSPPCLRPLAVEIGGCDQRRSCLFLSKDSFRERAVRAAAGGQES